MVARVLLDRPAHLGTHGVLGLCVVVVSGAHGPAHLDAREDAFLGAFQQTLADMGEEEFEKQRAALLALKMMKVGGWGVTSGGGGRQ